MKPQKNIFALFFSALVVVSLACSSAASQPTETPAPTDVPPTHAPTNTPPPTATLVPTATFTPAPTATPLPQDYTLENVPATISIPFGLSFDNYTVRGDNKTPIEIASFITSDSQAFIRFSSMTNTLNMTGVGPRLGKDFTLALIESFTKQQVTASETQDTSNPDVYTFQWETPNGQTGEALYDVRVKSTLIILVSIYDKESADMYKDLFSQVFDSYTLNP
ncbi:MAG: hypothetical protein LC099_04445 [Anaerolineales bacterium]|nr:hypothetical protein [Anaerolineales bacterium]